MTYLQMVEAHRETAADVAARSTGLRVITIFPHLAELRDPAMGYVERPLDVVAPAAVGEPGPADLVLLPVEPATLEMRSLHALVRGRQRLARWERRGVVSDLYGPPGRAATTPPP
jgi:hypothetical protein